MKDGGEKLGGPGILGPPQVSKRGGACPPAPPLTTPMHRCDMIFPQANLIRYW